MKRLFSAGLIGIGAGFAAYRSMRRNRDKKAEQRQTATPASQEEMFRYMTTYFLPVWTAAGLSDYLCHRATNIERTSGTKESALHLLMLAEGAPIVVAGLFLDMNALALAIMTAAAAVHEGTVVWDFAYASDKRPTGPIEQHTHSFLEVAPLSLVAFAAATHWDQFAALFGQGKQRPEWKLRFKRPPVSIARLLSMMAAMFVLVVLPHCEELLRCWVAERHGEKGSATPPALPEIMHTQAA